MRLRHLYCCRPTRRFSDASNASHASIPAATSLYSEKALGLAPLLVTELTNSTCVKCRGVVSAFGRPMVFYLHPP
jgi:hypothetical protein